MVVAKSAKLISDLNITLPFAKSHDGGGLQSALSDYIGCTLQSVAFDNIPAFCVRFRKVSCGSGELVFDHSFDSNAVVLHRLLETRELVKAIFDSVTSNGFIFNFGDGGGAGEVSFCSVEQGACLVPDSEFFAKEGYIESREAFSNQPVWTEKSAFPYWRGSSTGFRDGDSILSLPRAKLCLLCNALGYDAKITQAFQCRDESEKTDLMSAGIMGPIRSWADALHKRYNIDIDGNTSAWSSLFIKLLAGGVVLKVTSPHGFRQWYYDRLVPWVNFVPIRSDLSDLAQAVEKLENDPRLAQAIAENGRNLALSMTVDSEVAIAIERIKTAFSSAGTEA